MFFLYTSISKNYRQIWSLNGNLLVRSTATLSLNHVRLPLLPIYKINTTQWLCTYKMIYTYLKWKLFSDKQINHMIITKTKNNDIIPKLSFQHFISNCSITGANINLFFLSQFIFANTEKHTMFIFTWILLFTDCFVCCWFNHSLSFFSN